MSVLVRALLFASGLDVAEVRLWDAAAFRADRAAGRALPVALAAFAGRIVGRVLWLLWKLFAPYVILRQTLAVVVLQVSHEAVLPLLRRVARAMLRNAPQNGAEHAASSADPRVAVLRKQMDEAESYDEWRDASRVLEAVLAAGQGKPVVPPTPASSPEDGAQNTSRIQRMNLKTNLYKQLTALGEVDELMYRLRGELLRKHWGLGSGDDSMTRENPAYRVALHEYMDSVCNALALIAHGAATREVGDLQTRIQVLAKRVDFFSETLHSFGRTALMLSGGARLGLLHLGVVRALVDQKLLPRVISGSSAGSIVAVMLGAYRDEELDEHLFTPENLNLHFFEFVRSASSPPSSSTSNGSSNPTVRNAAETNPLLAMLLLLPPPLPSLINAVSEIVPAYTSTGTLLDVNVLARAIRDATGDLTFHEAFERTGRIINITVSPTGDNDFPMLLNYLTTPRVLLWSASVASCAIPGVFAPVELMAKNMKGEIVPFYFEGLKWADGSVENDLPMQRLSELFNINHFIVSQVNPHARLLAPMGQAYISDAPLLTDGPYARVLKTVARVAGETSKVVVNFCRDQSRSSVKHLASALMVVSPILPIFAPLKHLGKSAVPILTQKYTGDITIMPPLTFKGMVTILANPSPEEYLEDLRRGERLTWPQISRIRLHVAIEFLLDDCRQTCRRQLQRLEQDRWQQLQELQLQQQQQQQQGEGGADPSTSPRLSRALSSPRASKALLGRRDRGIPTASVLNLNELETMSSAVSSSSAGGGAGAVGSPVANGEKKPPLARPRRGSSLSSSSLQQQQQQQHPLPQQTMRPFGLGRTASFMGLSDKLKSRVQSFAADLSVIGAHARSDSMDMIHEGGNGGDGGGEWHGGLNMDDEGDQHEEEVEDAGNGRQDAHSENNQSKERVEEL